MKYLHVMNYSNYIVTKSFVRFIDEFFDNNEHVFALVGDFDSKFSELSGSCMIIHLKNRNKLIPYLKEADLVLLHALTFNAEMQLFSLLNSSVMKKIVWISWGGDLYKKKNTRNIKGVINSVVKKLFIRRLRFFVSIFDPDAKYFSENYKSKAKILNSCYVGGCYLDIYKKHFQWFDLTEKYKNGETINILVGHQANPVLNHVRVLKSILPYKNENIMIYIPLSYGDAANAKQVETTAKELYGEKVIILKDWINPDEYDNILASMDVAVFDTMRQIGLGNINKLIHMNKKVFLFPGSVMHEYYLTNNVPIFDCTCIGKIEFADFIYNERSDSNEAFIKDQIINIDKKIQQWNNIFMLVEEADKVSDLY